METVKVRIVVPDDAPPALRGTPAEAELRRLGHLIIYDTLPPSEADLAQRLRDAHVAVNIRSSSRFSEAVLAQCPHLRHIAVYGIGVDNIDLEACRRRGIVVSNTPGYSADSVAELAIALLLAVANRLVVHDRLIRQGRWAERGYRTLLAGKTLGVVGLGPIGERVAALGKALGMRVVAWTFHPSPERAQRLGVEFVSLEDLFRQSDAVSLHLRLSPESRGLVSRRLLEMMKPTAILVNTARGPVVDEEALADLLAQKRIAGAGLDVFGREPLPPEHPFCRLDNVVLSPHTGGMTPEATAAGMAMVVENIRAWLEGRRLRVVV
ncbi:MAG: glycerate dehydrogenase [Dehalococcoidia bacterium]|nr:glycerate dehydrogenase [Dehalococcoidia bacterium]MDW8119566.1 NAD(P)-dependent oxidoreductase [Chloroflexota bacterium]